jgi:nucleotide-binding universal stress UspA family protein
MMKRVLVPLDKTEAAEEILPLVALLTKAGASVRLLHVGPFPEAIVADDGRTIAYSDQETARMEASWADYVHSVKTWFGIEVEDAIRFGDPATEIMAEAEASGADTIVVSTTSSSALKRALLGSVAEAVLRRAAIGVLLYRPAPAF